MAEVFYGAWTVEVLAKDAAFGQRFVIAGSDAADGDYPGVTGTPPVSATGQRWTLALEWNDNAGSGWLPSDVRRTSTAFRHWRQQLREGSRAAGTLSGGR